MWLENLNILSAWWFMFFLLILVIGYFIVEILFWELYPFKEVLARNNNSVLDRIIHYVIWGIFWNIIFSLFLYYTEWHIPIIEVFDNSQWIAQQFNEVFWVKILSYQIINFSIFYLWFFIFVASMFRFWLLLILDFLFYLREEVHKQYRMKKMKEESAKKKSKKKSS